MIEYAEKALLERYREYGRFLPLNISRREEPMNWEALDSMFEDNAKQFRGLLYDQTRARAKELVDDILERIDAVADTDFSSLEFDWMDYDDLIDAILDDAEEEKMAEAEQEVKEDGE